MHMSSVVFGAFLLLAGAGVSAGPAVPAGQPQTVDGMRVYVGVLPAAMVEGHPPGHPEAAMHGGPPRGRHRFHVLVALFDAGSGERIAGAEIEAGVAEVGLAGTQRRLEPMVIAGTETYGGYFKLDGDNPFRITLDIRRPGAQRASRAEFEYRHPWVAR
ncbi:hypothetical protein [Immundisolibacter sp.]|jgi:hypothetical protein|nr:hypothetical protein [Immundisolibacter sp.]MEA3220729.1 hypothetical protein [Immundisolibacter sp.]